MLVSKARLSMVPTDQILPMKTFIQSDPDSLRLKILCPYVGEREVRDRQGRVEAPAGGWAPSKQIDGVPGVIFQMTSVAVPFPLIIPGAYSIFQK